MAEDLAARFRPIHEAGTQAFNDGDLEGALGGLPETFEWHPYDADPEESVLRGPEEVQRYFGKYREVFADWHSEPLEYKQLGESTVLVHHVITGTSRGAGVPVEIEVFEVWDLDDLQPRRVRQFTSRVEAMAAATG